MKRFTDLLVPRSGRARRRGIARALPLRFTGFVESLEDRRVMAANVLASLDGTISQAGSPTELTLQIDSGASMLLGFRVHATSGNLDPAASKILLNGVKLTPESAQANIDLGDSVSSDSLVLAKLGPGEYKVLVLGTSGVGNFHIDVFLPGDADGDNKVSDAESTMAAASYVQNEFGSNHVSTLIYRKNGIDFNQDLYSADFDSNQNGEMEESDKDQVAFNAGKGTINVTLIGDNTAPSIVPSLVADTGLSATDRITNNASVRALVTDDNTIDALTARVDGSAAVNILGKLNTSTGVVTLSAADLASIAGTALAQGSHTVTFAATDRFGNASAPVAFTFTLDTVAPTAGTPDLTAATDSGVNTDNITNVARPAFTVAAENGARVELFSSLLTAAIAQGIVSGASITLTSGVDLANGVHNITARVTDVAGNVTTSSLLAVTIDRSAPTTPTLTLRASDDDTAPAGDQSTSKTAVVLEGTTSANTLVRLQRSPNPFATPLETTSDASGNFTFSVNLSFGQQTFTVTASDVAGNQSSFVRTVTRNALPVLATTIADTSSAEDAAFSLNVSTNFTDANTADGDTLAYTATLVGGAALPTWLTLNSATGVFSGTPANGDVAVLNIVVTATDDLSATVSDTFQLTITNVNDNPTVATPIPNTNTNEDAALNLSVAANFADADTIHGDVLTYAATLEGGGALPAWISFNTTTGTFTGTPTNADVGSINITVTATDQSTQSVSDTFALTVVNTNDAPTVATTIDDQSVNEDSPFNLNISANFADVDAGDTLTYTATLQGGGALPAWLTLNPTTGVFSGTPLNADVGTILVTVTATDSQTATASDTFELEVINTNDAPIINNQSLSVQPDSNTGTIVGTVAATDPDVGDTFIYTITAGNDDGIFAIDANTGQVTVILDDQLPEGAGPFNLTVQVNDGDVTASATVTINVVVNNPPVVANPIPNQNATEDAPFSFTFADNAFTDADLETLTYTATLANNDPLPAWLTFNPATRTFSGTPANGDVGLISIKVTATDPAADFATDTFDLTVANVNDAPQVVTPIPAQSVNEDSPFNLDVSANFTDVDAGDTLTLSATLQGGGALPTWLTFNPTTGEFSGTPANGDVGTIQITVTATDSQTATATSTFSLQVVNVNDPPTVATPIADQTATQFQNFNFVVPANSFSDIDAGDTLTYTATLDNGDPLPTWLTFNPTTRTFSGTPGANDLGEIFVKVTATDVALAAVSDTFKLTVNTGPSVQVQLVIRNTATGGTEFTFFAANPSSGTDVGIGRFQVTGGGSSLKYSFTALDSVDLDGTRTPGNTSDDVTALTFRDSNGQLFNILADPDRVVNAAAGTVTGSWDTAEGFNAGAQTSLYGGLVFVQIVTASQTVKLAGKNISPSAELTTLPTSIDDVVVGDQYVVEVWVKDFLQGSTGLSSANVDILYSDKSTATAVVKGSPDSPFTESTSGSFDNVTHRVDSLGGGTLFAGVGLEPAFARLGFARITAAAGGTENFTLDINEIFRRGSGTAINIGDIDVINESVKHLVPLTFTVQAGSPIIVTEGSSTAQSAGVSDRAVLQGTISAAVDVDNPTFIKFTGSNLDFIASGNWLPNSTPADFGFTRSVFSGVGTLNVALRNLIVDVTSNNIPLTPAGGNFSFSTAAQTWKLASSNGGTADGQLIVSGSPQTPTSLNVSGTVLNAIGTPAVSTFRQVSANTYAIDLQIPRQFMVTIGSETFTFNVTGSVTAQATTGAPLTGTVVGESSPVADGTGAFITVVKDRTPVSAQGEVTSLPQSETWVNEWDSYWAEVWVRTTEAAGVTAGSVNLTYDNRYFTPTRIEHAGAFGVDTAGAIDHAAGVITNLGGTALRSDLGSGEFVLLGRVKFEALAGNQVPFDLASGTFGPYDLGLELTSADLEIAGAAATSVVLGDSPRTELWAVPYDVNDDDRIDFGDFSVFASTFQSNVLDADSPLAAALDFDRSGRVDMGDFSFFASNFFTSKAAHAQLVFPESFLQKWIGSEVEHDGGNTVDEVLAAAVGAWQTALGLDTPIDIQLVVRDFGNDQLGAGQILGVDAAGIPDRGRVTIDDDANGIGWFTDLGQSPSGTGKYDLYTVLLHEIGHTLGFTSAYSPFAAQLQNNGDGALFVGNDFIAELDGAGLHLDDLAHPGDLMNDTLAPGERKLPSLVDTLMLQAAYAGAAGGADFFASNSAPLMAASQAVAPPVAAQPATPAATIAVSNTKVGDASQPSREIASLLSDDFASLVLAESQSDLERLATNRDSAVSRLRSQGVALTLRDTRPVVANRERVFAEFGAEYEPAADDYALVADADELDSLDIVLSGWDRI